MIIKKKLKKLSLSLFFCFFIFLLISFFFSFNKIFIPLILSLLILFFNIRVKKIILINLILLVFLLKIIFIFFDPKDYSGILSKTIYEKNFLYGVKNLNFTTTIFGGNMDPNNKKKRKNVNIITDNLGFRNSIDLNSTNYILVGDSMLHNHRIDHSKLINTLLNEKSSKKFYNAAISSTDIGHYFETIKYFKDNNINQKIIMFIFTGNDLLNYKKIQKNYSKRLENSILRNYFEVKEFFDFFTKIKFILNLFKDNKLSSKIDSDNFIKNSKILFYKSYYLKINHKFSFSSDFEIYNEIDPDIVIIIPTKAQVYCKYIKKFNCYDNDYPNILANFSLFDNSKIYDSTNFLRSKADEYLNNNQLIYETDDTHLDEIGLKLLSEFLLNKLNN